MRAASFRRLRWGPRPSGATPTGASRGTASGTSFCDLALAGGPPHRGTLLRPATPAEIAAEPDATAAVASELTRAIRLAVGPEAWAGGESGWLAVPCESPGAAAWLALAITAENVSCRRRGDCVELPIGPRVSLREGSQERSVRARQGAPLLGRAPEFRATVARTGARLGGAGDARGPGCRPGRRRGGGRDASECPARRGIAGGRGRARLGGPGVRATRFKAGWMLRAVASNGVMCRHESATLYVAVGRRVDEGQFRRVVDACLEAWEVD